MVYNLYIFLFQQFQCKYVVQVYLFWKNLKTFDEQFNKGPYFQYISTQGYLETVPLNFVLNTAHSIVLVLCLLQNLMEQTLVGQLIYVVKMLTKELVKNRQKHTNAIKVRSLFESLIDIKSVSNNGFH